MAYLIQVMNPVLGDRKIKDWDPDKPGDKESIIAFFKEKLSQGFRAYAFKKGEDIGKLVTKFDETAERILLSADRVRVTVPTYRG
jgi:hypothetical protein